jgi:hypothetical protein
MAKPPNSGCSCTDWRQQHNDGGGGMSSVPDAARITTEAQTRWGRELSQFTVVGSVGRSTGGSQGLPDAVQTPRSRAGNRIERI